MAQAIPTYAMQYFKLSGCIIDNLTKMCREFWWGHNGNERKLALIGWGKLCKSKDEGGVGMWDLGVFNTSPLAKQLWRIVNEHDSLAAVVLKGKYFPRTTTWETKISLNASYTWKSLLSARDLVRNGSHWVIGNGRTTWIWKDRWVEGLPGGCLRYVPPTQEMELDCVAAWRNT